VTSFWTIDFRYFYINHILCSRCRLLSFFSLQFVITLRLFICQLSTQPCIGIVSKTVFFFYGRQKCILWLLKWPTVVSNLTNFSRLRYTRVCHGLAWGQLVLVQDRKKIERGKIAIFFMNAKLSSLLHYYIPQENHPTSDLINHRGQMNSTRVGNPPENDQTSATNFG